MSLRGAINAMCKGCIYDPIGGRGNWRQQTEACTAKHCPLWQFRPKSSAGATIEADPSQDSGPEASVQP